MRHEELTYQQSSPADFVSKYQLYLLTHGGHSFSTSSNGTSTTCSRIPRFSGGSLVLSRQRSQRTVTDPRPAKREETNENQNELPIDEKKNKEKYESERFSDRKPQISPAS